MTKPFAPAHTWLIGIFVAFIACAAVGCDSTAASFESPQQIANAVADAGHEVAMGPAPDENFITELGGESYDGVIDSVQASIHVFPNEETVDTWLEMSKAFGGIAVAGGNWAISLDSDQPGRQQSTEMAPVLADLLGGEVVQ